jgi:hypothetical protein
VADHGQETRCCEEVQNFFFYPPSFAVPCNKSTFNYPAFSKLTVVTATAAAAAAPTTNKKYAGENTQTLSAKQRNQI